MKIDLEDALAQLEDARQADIDEAVANSLFRVGVASLERGKVDEAFEALDEAYYHCKKLDNDPGRAQVCLRLSEVAMAQGDHGLAERLLQEAWPLFKSLQDLTGQVGVLERWARLLAEAGRDSEALEKLEQGLSITSQGSDELGQLFFHQQMAPLFRRLDRMEEALNSYRCLGRLADALGDQQRTALALVGMGSCLAALDQPQEAEKAMSQAIEVYRNLGQLQLAAQVEAEMARLGVAGLKEEEKR